MGVGPDPAGSVRAIYTGRSTANQVLLSASVTSNHCTGSTTCVGAPATKSSGRSRPQRRITGSPPGNGAFLGQFLNAGDVIESEITFLGRQRNVVIAEDAGSRRPTFGAFKRA